MYHAIASSLNASECTTRYHFSSSICRVMDLAQIVNTSDIRLSSISGEGIDQFVQVVASAMMSMPHVKETVPRAFVDLKENLVEWSQELVKLGSSPVCSEGEVRERVLAPRSGLPQWLADPLVVAQALTFLEAGGSIIKAHHGDTVTLVLDPRWLANTFACIITADPGRLKALPGDLTKRGILRHDVGTLAMVWPDADDYSASLRETLVFLLHHFDLAFSVRGEADSELGFSLVPCMLPQDEAVGGPPLDVALGPLKAGEAEAGLHYVLDFLPADLWPSLILRCAAMVDPYTCTRSSATLRFAGQCALLTLDASSRLTLITRGPSPTDLRVRFYWILVELLTQKYPDLTRDKSLHTVCHVCHNPSSLFGRPLKDAQAGRPIYCSICTDDVHLPVEDIVSEPAGVVDSALEECKVEPLTPESVKRLRDSVTRMVDTAWVLWDHHGRRSTVWLPVPKVGRTASDPAAALKDLSQWHDDLLGWVPVCEDASGWHVLNNCLPVLGTARLRVASLQAVVPLLLRVASMMCAVGGSTSELSAAVADSQAWLTLVKRFPRTMGAGGGHVDWVEFCHGLSRALRCASADDDGAALEWRSGHWVCLRHVE
jgi:hypothetical protein